MRRVSKHETIIDFLYWNAVAFGIVKLTKADFENMDVDQYVHIRQIVKARLDQAEQMEQEQNENN